MKNKITLIVSIAAIILAGFTWFKNPQQSPTPYGNSVIPPKWQAKDRVDTLIKPNIRQREYHIYKVQFMRPVLYTVKQKGLPTYDSLMINEPFSRFVLQGGNEFDEELFLQNTYNSTRVVDFEMIR